MPSFAVTRRLSSSASLRRMSIIPGHLGHELRRKVAGRLSNSVGLAIAVWSLALYVLTFMVVGRHYREYPPHYDSIGFYAGLFQRVRADGCRCGLRPAPPLVASPHGAEPAARCWCGGRQQAAGGDD
jgi:hypothetical protein